MAQLSTSVRYLAVFCSETRYLASRSHILCVCVCVCVLVLTHTVLCSPSSFRPHCSSPPCTSAGAIGSASRRRAASSRTSSPSSSEWTGSGRYQGSLLARLGWPLIICFFASLCYWSSGSLMILCFSTFFSLFFILLVCNCVIALSLTQIVDKDRWTSFPH